MPSIAANLSWGTYAWSEQGEEWSGEWGDADTQWHATILPRIRPFLPAKRILEIAPGFGRWTGYLIDASEDFVGIDLNPQCISHCEKRFASSAHARFAANDGKSLDAVPNGSIDFAFSFDSLVHVEIDAIESYLKELARKLSPDGIAFLHHSNLGEYEGIARSVSQALLERTKTSPLTLKVLRRLQLTTWEHWRAPSVTAAKVADLAKTAGLSCISQEVINWGRHNSRLIDCLSTFTRPGSKWDRPNLRIRNPKFMDEARSVHVISDLHKALRQ